MKNIDIYPFYCDMKFGMKSNILKWKSKISCLMTPSNIPKEHVMWYLVVSLGI